MPDPVPIADPPPAPQPPAPPVTESQQPSVVEETGPGFSRRMVLKSWAPTIVSVMVLGLFGFSLWAVLIGEQIPLNNRDVAMIMIGCIANMASAVVFYWIGSSSGSARKDEQMHVLISRGAPANNVNPTQRAA